MSKKKYRALKAEVEDLHKVVKDLLEHDGALVEIIHGCKDQIEVLRASDLAIAESMRSVTAFLGINPLPREESILDGYQ